MDNQSHILVSLIKGCDTLTVLKVGEEVPHGCALYNIYEDCNVHLLVRVRFTFAIEIVQGMIDFDTELDKIETKMTKVEGALALWKTKKEAEGYAKVRDDVKEVNETKVN